MNSLLNVLVAAAMLSHQKAPAEPARPEKAYWGIVEQYAHGDRGIALAAIGPWTSKDLEAIKTSVNNLAKAARRCTTCEALVLFEALPLRAAVLLHGERDRAERMWRIARRDGQTECSTGAHAWASEQLLQFAQRQSDRGAFVPRFAASMSLHYRATLCFGLARGWADAGLKLSGKEASLFLARGLADEALGVLGYVQPSGTEDRQGRLELARESFEQAVALDPSAREARMRLGRVQWRLGKMAAARASLEKALGQGEDPVLFLTHLFLGRVLEDSQDLEGAVREYQAALDREPRIQTAAIALAHALTLRGNPAAAREVLAKVLPFAGRRVGTEPYWNYLVGTPNGAEAELEKLRRESIK